jgi:hypothetical protein
MLAGEYAEFIEYLRYGMLCESIGVKEYRG